jgi:hypothetical protein
VTTAAEAAQMASCRPNTTLCTLPGGHVLHQENFAAFSNAVKLFLNTLPNS